MTDHTQNTIQRAPARRLNGNLIFFGLCLIVAISIVLFGGSPLFAALFGAISLYGIVKYSLQRTDHAGEDDENQEAIIHTPHRSEDAVALDAMFKRNQAMLLEPEFGLLSNNMFHRGRNPDRHRNNFNDPFD